MNKYTKKINNEVVKAYNMNKKIFIEKVQDYYYISIDNIKAYKIHELDTPFRETENTLNINSFFDKNNDELIDAIITSEKINLKLFNKENNIVKIQEINGERYVWVDEKLIKNLSTWQIKICKENSKFSPVYGFMGGCQFLVMPFYYK